MFGCFTPGSTRSGPGGERSHIGFENGMGQAKNLVLTAAIAVDGDALAVQLIGQTENLINIIDSCICWKIDGF